MKNYIIGLLAFLLINCETSNDVAQKLFIAEIVEYDLNCSTCIIQFKSDTSGIQNILGTTEGNKYNAVNLNRTDFKIGQQLKVKARPAEKAEIPACITLYTTTNYPHIFLSNFEEHKDQTFIETFELKVNECANAFDQASICFDSVITDSRCPLDVNCVWEGNAKVLLNIHFAHKRRVISFELNTNPDFATDTTINNLNISLSKLAPYPVSRAPIAPIYKAILKMTDLNSVKNNAQILSFNPDKSACSWGWTIKVNNDTIKSDNELIGKEVGYVINKPVDVYLELGNKIRTCANEEDGVDYYDIKHIIKKQLPDN